MVGTMTLNHLLVEQQNKMCSSFGHLLWIQIALSMRNWGYFTPKSVRSYNQGPYWISIAVTFFLGPPCSKLTWPPLKMGKFQLAMLTKLNPDPEGRYPKPQRSRWRYEKVTQEGRDPLQNCHHSKTLPETTTASKSTWKSMVGRWNFFLGLPIFRAFCS